MPNKLSDAFIKALAPPATGYRIIRDTEVKGLGVRITSAGHRAWIYEYEADDGGSNRWTIGPFDAFTTGQARKEVLDMRAGRRRGEDPAAERRQRREEAQAARAEAAKGATPPQDTVAAIAEMFLQDLRKRNRSPAYVRDSRGFLENHILPRLGDKRLADVTRRDVIAILDHVAAHGTRRVIGGQSVNLVGGGTTANRCLSALRACCNFAIDRDLLMLNPCHRVKPPAPERACDRVFSNDEIAEAWPAFTEMGGPYGAFLRLCLLTGQRKSEVAESEWDEFDLGERIWTVPARRTKASRATIVPLSPLAHEILAALPRKGRYVFSTTGAAPIKGFSKMKRAVDSRLLQARRELDPTAVAMPAWTVHDLRRSCATGMARLGISSVVIGRVLNHASSGVTARHYNHYEYLDEKRHALDVWAAHVERLIKPPGANVVSIAAGKRA